MTPPDDTHGCLQDIHWAMGGFGYFPTYTLGNLNSAQIFQTALRDQQVHTAFQNGDSLPLLSWLRQEIHSKGATLFPQELMRSATGQETQSEPYLTHLRERFL